MTVSIRGPDTIGKVERAYKYSLGSRLANPSKSQIYWGTR
jgi:hypothetical protein